MRFTNRKQISPGGTEISESRQIVLLQRRLGAAIVIGDEVPEQYILRRESVIDAAGELIQFPLAGRRSDEVVNHVRVGNQCQKFQNDRVRYRSPLCRGWN